jgi:RND family efflux transporter MFP subunit
VLGPVAGCEQAAPAQPPGPAVTVASPEVRDVARNHDFTGTLEAIEFVEIRARVEGYLQTVAFEDSDDVETGDPLFVIDPAPFQAALDAVEADLARKHATMKQVEWDLGRVQELYDKEAANLKELHYATTAWHMAGADVKAAEAAVVKAELDLSYTDIRSPIDGRLSRTFVDAGNLVGAGEKTLLTTVVKMDEMYVYFNIPETFLIERLAARQPGDRRRPYVNFSIGLVGEEGYPHEGQLNYLDNTVDPDTGTITVRGVVSNDDELLFPGAFARVRVEGKIQENAVLVSEQAIGTDLGGKYLLVVTDENIVEHRPVKLGQLVEGMRVIEEGLGPDEVYIVNGLQRARPGLPVTPQREDAPATPQAPLAESPDS